MSRSGASASFARRVVHWQRRHGRHDLPWQATRDPYRVWLSEVMLQQTQVATVLGYYERFLERFPDVQALAAAPLDAVLAAWSGLGYYSRARNLHRCAQQLVEAHGGRFPERAAQLQALPGIGRSTAAAIASTCFGERVAILDGNVKRVLSRHLAFAEDLAAAPAVQRLWQQAEALVAELPAADVPAYTQGLMDLGATLCTTVAPRCGECPVGLDCRARLQGEPLRFPVKSRRLQRQERRSLMLCLQRQERVWLVQRPAQGVWGGLWCLPLFDEGPARQTWQSLQTSLPGRGEALPLVRHVLTHFQWLLEPWRWQLPARISKARLGAIEASLGPGRWCSLPEALGLGLPAPVRKLLSA